MIWGHHLTQLLFFMVTFNFYEKYTGVLLFSLVVLEALSLSSLIRHPDQLPPQSQTLLVIEAMPKMDLKGGSCHPFCLARIWCCW